MAVYGSPQNRNARLPDGWVATEIGAVVDLNPPKPSKDAVPADAEVTFVPMPAVDAQSGTIATPERRPFGTVRKGYTAFRDGDVIFAKITPCMENGKAAIARHLANGLGFGSTEFHVLRPNGSVIPEYLFYYLRQESFRKAAEAEMTGSVGQKRVPPDFLKNAYFPLPPLTEQKRIVATIEELLPRAKALRERLIKAKDIMKRFRQSVLASACSGRLSECWREKSSDAASGFNRLLTLDMTDRETEDLSPSTQNEKRNGDAIPSKWQTVRLREILTDLKYGTSKKCTQEERGLPVLRIPNVIKGHIDRTEMKFAELNEKEYEQLKLREGDILFVRSNGSPSLVGRTALVRKDENGFAYAGYLLRLRTDADRISPAFLNVALASQEIRTQIELPMRSTSGVHINSREVGNLELRLPPLEEQKEIVSKVESLSKLAEKVEKRFEGEFARSERMIQSTLAKAFRGELVSIETWLQLQEARVGG